MGKAALQFGQNNFLWLKIKILNKVKNTKMINYMLNGKDAVIDLIAG